MELVLRYSFIGWQIKKKLPLTEQRFENRDYAEIISIIVGSDI